MRLVCGNPTCAAALMVGGSRMRSGARVIEASLDPKAVGHAEAVRAIASCGWRRHRDPGEDDTRWVCGRCAD